MASALLPPMQLYHLSLEPSHHLQQSVYGSFSAAKQQEIVAVRGSGRYLELLRPDAQSGKVESVCLEEVFGVIRSVCTFRLIGGNRDYVVVGSDSGRIAIHQYSNDKQRFQKIHEEQYGKTGCRRIIPGQYVCSDPRGRALMVAAVEKQKFIYVLNRDADNNLTISSPLEAHKSHTIVFSVVGVDVGYDSPMFACIEQDYEQPNKQLKQLTYYELDLGLNTVTRRYAERIPATAHHLIAVPGDKDGPSGVIVCCEGYLLYKNIDHPELKCPYPRRFGLDVLGDNRDVMIISSSVHQQKGMFFFLLQTEHGDLLKLSIQYNNETGAVNDLTIQYFDTLPLSTSLNIMKTGFLFVAAEAAAHSLYQFISIGDDDTEAAVTNVATGNTIVQFIPRQLRNLLLIDELPSISPVLGSQVADLSNAVQDSSQTPTDAINTPQIYTICGRSARSTLRVLRQGLAVSELAVSELPGTPTNVFTLKRSVSDQFPNYIIVTFTNATIVLQVSESVEEVADTGLLDNVQTLDCHLMVDNSMVQVHSSGVHVVRPDKRTTDWRTPSKKQIVATACNERQVAIGLSGGELVVFELDVRTGSLQEVQRKELGNDIQALALSTMAADRQRASYLAVSTLDNVIRILSFDQQLQQLSLQATNELAVSIKFIQHTANTAAASQGTNLQHATHTYLYAGLRNGLLLRNTVDDSLGTLSDQRRRVVGTAPVKLAHSTINHSPALTVLTPQHSYITYTYQGQLYFHSISYNATFAAASYFNSDSIQQDGLVGISGNSLRIVTYNSRLNSNFNEQSVALRYTPRKLLIHPVTQSLIIIETDQNSYGLQVKRELQKELDLGAETSESTPSELMIGSPQAGRGRWASCLRIIHPLTLQTSVCIEFDANEAAFSACTVQFVGHESELFLAVGTVKDLTYTPRTFSACSIRIYRFVQNHSAIELVHITPLNDIPLAMISYHKRLLVAVGPTLRMMELGKKKLLRKVENTSPTLTTITELHAAGDRVYIGDMTQSVMFANYNPTTRQLNIVADSTLPRYVSSTTVLDYDTVALGDKFGNLVVSRLPAEVREELERDVALNTISNNYQQQAQPRDSDAAVTQLQRRGAPYKLNEIINFYVGETITSLHKVALQVGGSEVLLYTTIHGGVGAFVPLVRKDDIDYLQHLELQMRLEYSSMIGRDHLAYRSYYSPVKGVIDGDLLERYSHLPYDRQVAVAEELMTSPNEIAKKLQTLRDNAL